MAGIFISCFPIFPPNMSGISARSPWWGGWWERLVRTVKNAIRKTIGKQCLVRMEMEICLCEVAASVNSRPLTFVGTDVGSRTPLTPNHFLAGQGYQGLESRVVEDPENMTAERLNDFWKVWSNEYIRNLPPAFQKFRKQGNLKVGSVVLIREDGQRRMEWAMGVVEKLHKSQDGVSRSADLHTNRGLRTQAVQRLYNLEMSDEQVPEVSVEDKGETTSCKVDGPPG